MKSGQKKQRVKKLRVGGSGCGIGSGGAMSCAGDQSPPHPTCGWGHHGVRKIPNVAGKNVPHD